MLKKGEIWDDENVLGGKVGRPVALRRERVVASGEGAFESLRGQPDYARPPLTLSNCNIVV